MSPYKRTIPWWSVTGSSEPRRILPGAILLLLSWLMLLAADVAAAKADTPETGTPQAGTPRATQASVDEFVEVVSSSSCGKNRRCHRLRVTCGGLEPRSAEVLEYEVEASKGTIVVATGVYGNRPYDQFPERQRTLDELREAGFEVFVLRWSDGKLGWGSTAEGAGYEAPMCGYSAVVRWLVAERADRPQVLCAQGNSGAALQIAYGLSVYGLGDLLDVGVLSGGPPLVRIDDFCFRPTRQQKAKLWRANGRRITDYLMGWDGNGDHCKNAQGDASAVEALQATGLLPAELETESPPNRRRQLNFPTTQLIFVQSEGDKSASQGRLYYDAVTSQKSWHALPGRVHGVDREAPSAAEVRRLLIKACSAVAP